MGTNPADEEPERGGNSDIPSGAPGLGGLKWRHLRSIPSLTMPSRIVSVVGRPVALLLAICGGLWHDSLSANPLGISILPLFVIGLALHSNRGLILKDEPFARFMLGMGASAAAPLMTLLLLLNTDHKPMIGWFTLWQWVVMSLIGAVVTPWWFRFFYWLNTTLSYKPLGGTSFRADREIKRGR